jgi:hypothetical protein
LYRFVVAPRIRPASLRLGGSWLAGRSTRLLRHLHE